ncbi:MAG: hydroxyquinol 1,2-dioxygenase [Candidatus Thiodiazotropha sp. (ex Lucina aurantia)]|uniref:Hydroxyquinol 1,2-dioxygenase n=1 Tax=Candidatus Thiodiazotropha taylori TaxID=2792791 RepID=A0A9E4TUB4_9GAMM|nr:hydroxyquinol 1,2-dioxygenase [Candidatus Thiodiazotropha taylori]MBT3038117.1 hydroxyquinol 1,2-dioxygenase [Candidatus Thiodiazotropha sp. (ex Codakia orbicularis)]MBV2102289.1 hydroxyquinol 1,2-dioxygenase [Candidatus Thiodiazotropha sp. (ex Lucina aurantia)]MCG7861749.1 hydroxyquinol 1,2-dioxygenase [Candidatus Thiodiazotropha endolucinida]MBT3021952.1 hydroxyquinol 1,2-dioxygenase [Candidatus Thiodiazotropha taylori]
MTQYRTEFGALNDFEKGSIEIIDDNPKYYTFSNVFEVADKSTPYEKVVVAKNLQYVIEAIRAEGASPWYVADHDEFVVVMDGEVQVDLVKLDDPESNVPAGKDGAVKVEGEPQGRKMGLIKLGHGHQALLPKGAAYRFRAASPACMIQQSILGDLSVQKWADICYT